MAAKSETHVKITHEGATAEPERPTAAAKREESKTNTPPRHLAKVAPDEDPANVAAAIVVFATETIKRSAHDLREARAYLDGMRDAIDALLVGAFPSPEPETEEKK